MYKAATNLTSPWLFNPAKLVFLLDQAEILLSIKPICVMTNMGNANIAYWYEYACNTDLRDSLHPKFYFLLYYMAYYPHENTETYTLSGPRNSCRWHWADHLYLFNMIVFCFILLLCYPKCWCRQKINS